MELKDRLNILVQGSLLAQSKGVLSLDDAVYVKKAIDCINDNTELDISSKILIKTVTIAQSKGCYSLKDAYLIYAAINGIEDLLPKKNNTDEKENVKKDEK